MTIPPDVESARSGPGIRALHNLSGLPEAAAQRAIIVAVCHITDGLEDPTISEIVGIWVGKGRLTPEQWRILGARAKRGLER